MKKIIITGLILLSITYSYAQINAITETGDEVVLYHDGTWAYLNDSIVESKVIKVNDKDFTKSKSLTFLVKSKKVNIGIWISPKNWIFEKGAENEAGEFLFTRRGEDLYGMLISEKMQIPIETLREVAVDNAKDVAPDIKVIQEEYRNVNGVKVLMMQMSGTIQGMKVTYCGYYYSNENGTIQLLTYTSSNLFNEYFKDIEDFLNGFVEI